MRPCSIFFRWNLQELNPRRSRPQPVVAVAAVAVAAEAPQPALLQPLERDVAAVAEAVADAAEPPLKNAPAWSCISEPT